MKLAASFAGTCLLLLLSPASIGASQPIVFDWHVKPVEKVQKAARSGDKFAQLELGRRYEEGDLGLPRNYRLALKWYKRASRDESNALLVYSAPVGKEQYGRMSPVSSRRRPGLPAAHIRFVALKSRLERSQ